MHREYNFLSITAGGLFIWIAVALLAFAGLRMQKEIRRVNARAEKALRLHGLHESVFDGPQEWEGHQRTNILKFME